MTYDVKLYKCLDCGQVYPMVPYLPKAAPHGPNKDCKSRRWVEIEEVTDEDMHPMQEED